jgi:hypothetical protein
MTTNQTISWAEVLKVHKTQQAVNFIDERIASIICSPMQNKFVSDDKVIFSIPTRKHYLKLVSNMKLRISDNGPIHLFIKKEKNIWTDAGFFKLISFEEALVETNFLLQKIVSI